MTILDSDRGATGGLLISIAVAAAALLAVLPQPGPALARAQASATEAVRDGGEAGGKFEDRLAAAPGEAALAERRLHLPAAVLMPMLVDWGTPAADGALVASQVPRGTIRAAAPQPVRYLPVARPPLLALASAERPPEPAQTAHIVEPRPRDERGWSGLALATNAFDRVTGAVAAAGGWAVGSTASLLPDWR